MAVIFFIFFFLSTFFGNAFLYTETMKYIELIVLLNLAIHLSLVHTAYFLLHMKGNRIATGISCVLDTIYILLYLFYPYELEDYRYLFIVVIAAVPFVIKGITKCLMLCLVYLMLNFTLGGSAGILFHIMNHFSSVIISLVVLLVLVSIYGLYKKFHFHPEALEYDILIEDENRKIYLSGFCDTGNFLSTDDNIPIVFLKNNLKIGHYCKTIEMQSLSTVRMIPIFEVKSFKIKIKNKYVQRDVYLAFGDIAFNVMFGSNLLGG